MAEKVSIKKPTEIIRIARCNFCAKNANEVELLISSPSSFGPYEVLICNYCVNVCVDIIMCKIAKEKELSKKAVKEPVKKKDK
jgi:ATP-dependent protease Clp ATPase subunit